MSFDFIDMIVDTGEEYLTGAFYKRRPISPEDGRVTFGYRQLDPNAKVFDKVLGEVRKDRATYALKTNDNCGFNIGGYIQTQNGLYWEITEVITNEEVKGSNDALRWFKTAKNSECSIRMVQVDDLFNIFDTYDTECRITISSDKQIQHISVMYIGGDLGDGFSETVNSSVYSFIATKGSGVKMIITLTDNIVKEYTVSSDKTVVNRLAYRI